MTQRVILLERRHRLKSSPLPVATSATIDFPLSLATSHAHIKRPATQTPSPDKPMTDTPSGMHKGRTSYGDTGFSLFLRKAFIKGAGFTDAALDRPVIGIASTGSAYKPCHGNAPQLLEAVKRGVMLAGGLPMDFPTISLHGSFAAPTSMYLRNLMSMDTEVVGDNYLVRSTTTILAGLTSRPGRSCRRSS